MIDRTAPVRPGEELDLGSLEPWLRARLSGAEGPLAVEQFPLGHSNLTYLLRVGARELVLRRPPFGAKAIRAGHDMGREYRILSRLWAAWPKAPRALLFCEEEGSPLGAPFYLMERARGVILRSGQPSGEIPPERMRRVSQGLVDTLVEIHAIDYARAGLADLGHPEGYVERQARGWTERYRRSQTDEVAPMEAVAAWLGGAIPPSPAPALIHNDLKYDNLVLDAEDLTRVVAVLDWEMATIGDPLADLGTALAYWIDPDDPDDLRALPLGSTTIPGNLRRSEVAARYAEKSGREVRHLVFHYVAALFKVAVIAQQIYFRYAKGFTRDERFAGFSAAVRVIARQAARAIERDRIYGLG
jgi:aminoglycoside phosphotransferase (APT) family kinase protein